MRILVAVVGLVLAAVLAPLVIGSMWTASKVDDSDEYVATVAPLASDPALRRELGDALGTAVAEKLAQKMPIGMPDVAGDWIREAAVSVVNQPGFETFWRDANADAHHRFLRLMDEDQADPSGYVYVDATPLLAQIFAKLADKGLPVQVLAGMPLEIPVASNERLESYRTRYEWVNRFATIGPWLWGVLVLASVAIAPGWRGRLRAVSAAAVGVALGAVIVMLAPHPLTSYAASHAGVGDTELVRLILRVVTDSMPAYTRPFAFVALPVALLALLVSLVPTGRRRYAGPPAY